MRTQPENDASGSTLNSPMSRNTCSRTSCVRSSRLLSVGRFCPCVASATHFTIFSCRFAHETSVSTSPCTAFTYRSVLDNGSTGSRGSFGGFIGAASYRESALRQIPEAPGEANSIVSLAHERPSPHRHRRHGTEWDPLHGGRDDRRSNRCDR